MHKKQFIKNFPIVLVFLQSLVFAQSCAQIPHGHFTFYAQDSHNRSPRNEYMHQGFTHMYGPQPPLHASIDPRVIENNIRNYHQESETFTTEYIPLLSKVFLADSKNIDTLEARLAIGALVCDDVASEKLKTVLYELQTTFFDHDGTYRPHAKPDEHTFDCLVGLLQYYNKTPQEIEHICRTFHADGYEHYRNRSWFDRFQDSYDSIPRYMGAMVADKGDIGKKIRDHAHYKTLSERVKLHKDKKMRAASKMQLMSNKPLAVIPAQSPLTEIAHNTTVPETKNSDHGGDDDPHKDPFVESDIALPVTQKLTPYRISDEASIIAYNDVRLQNRIDAHHDIVEHGATELVQTYYVSPLIEPALQECRIDHKGFETCSGDQLQQALHADCVVMINALVESELFHAYTAPLHFSMKLLLQGTEIGRRFIQEYRLEEAIAMTDACWEFFKKNVKAVGEGASLGVIETLRRPWEPVVSLVSGACTAVTTAKRITKGILIAMIDQERTVHDFVEFDKRQQVKIESFKKNVMSMSSLKQEDWVRISSCLTTKLFLQGKILQGVGKLGTLLTDSEYVQELVAAARNTLKISEKEVVATTAEGIEFTFKAQANEVARAQANTVPKPGKQRGGGGLAYLNPNSPDNKVIMNIPLEAHAKGLLKEFNITAKMKRHIFGPEHIDRGILGLGESKDHILQLLGDIVKKQDYQGLLKPGKNIFKTIINNHSVEMRVTIEQGLILMMNAFVLNKID